MDLFEQLRREHEFGIGTIAGVAAKFGVHRRVVRQALSGALPTPAAPRCGLAMSACWFGASPAAIGAMPICRP